MACSCIQFYDFDLTYTSCEDVTYVDRSTWQAGGGSYSLIVIDEDGAETPYTVTAGIPLRLNVGKCAQGIYTFKAVSCTHQSFKKAAILCNFKCGFLKAISKLGAESPIIQSIWDRIEYIDLAVARDDIQTAKDLVKTVARDLKRINCECSCS